MITLKCTFYKTYLESIVGLKRISEETSIKWRDPHFQNHVRKNAINDLQTLTEAKINSKTRGPFR